MNPAEAAPSPGRRVVAWRAPIRALHWTIAATTAALFVTGKAEAKAVHLVAGPVLLVALAARAYLGFAGLPHERFRAFVARPRDVFAYLRGSARGTAPRTLGHNPAAGPVMLLLLATLLLTAMMGEFLRGADAHQGPLAGALAGLDADAVDAVAIVHESCAHLAVILVLIHFAGLAAHAVRHKENIAMAMVSGVKLIDPQVAKEAQ